MPSPSVRPGHREPPCPLRIRRIEPGGFAFIPNRFLRDGFLASLTGQECSLYLFLVLAGDRNGVSFYGYDAICSILSLPLESYLAARDALMDKDLLAFDGTRFQVLSLPDKPVPPPPPLGTSEDRQSHDSAFIRAKVLRQLASISSD